MSAPASTPFRTRASPEDVEVLSPSAATPSPAVGKKKKKKKKKEEEEEEEEVLMAVAEAASETSGDDDQGTTNGVAEVEAGGASAPGLLVPTVSRDASEDALLETKSDRCSAAAADGGDGGGGGEGKPLLRKNSTDVIGPNNFQKIKLLGKGDVGLVFLVKARNVEQLDGTFAMKVYKKSDIVKRNKVARVKLEREILSVTNHPFVVSMYAAFQTHKRLYVILQYCPGGELYRMIKRQPNGRIPEEWARFYAAEILIAVEYLHFMGYLYRDLKPENILLHATGHVMIADFDLAKHQVHEFTDKEKQQGASVMQFKKSTGNRSAHSSIGTPSSSVVELPERGTAAAGAAKKSRSSANVVVDQRTGQPVVLLNQQSYRFGAPVANNNKRGASSSGRGGSGGGGCCSCGAKAVLRPVLDTETQLAVDAFGDHLSTSFVGTIEYVAPEVIMQEGYSGSVDWWTFGVLLYEMVFGKTPFKGKDMNGTLAHVLNADIDFEMPDNDEISASKELRDLLPKLLEREVSDRLKSPDAIRSHPFFATIAWPLLRHMQPPYVPTLATETDTGNFRAFANFVDSDSDFEEEEKEEKKEEEGKGGDGQGDSSSSTRMETSTPVRNTPPSTPVAAAGKGDASSNEEDEDMISPAFTQRNAAVFKNFAYVDRLGERHWDLTYSPPGEYGAMKRVRGEHIESPASKQRRAKDGKA